VRQVRCIGSLLLAVAGLAVSSACVAQADAWPSRPIRIITPTDPGTITDYLPRTFGQYLQAQTKQAVLVENRPGANAIIGSEAAKNSAPDGYTFFVGSVSTHSANPALFAKLPYDPAKDFVEVGMFTIFQYYAVVRKDSPFNSLPQLIAAAKASPGKLNCGYSTIASRVPCELLKERIGADIVPVSFKGASAVLTGVAGGVVDFTIIDAGSATMAIQGGLLRPIGVTSPARVPQYPGVPTFTESLPGFVYEGWAGLSAPAGTPKPIIEKMNQYLRQALAEPEFLKGIESRGGTVRMMTATEHADWVVADRKRWKEWVKQANIQVQ
jgi:tripartite-type tricarboxylate transporter receptor subunit TctC